MISRMIAPEILASPKSILLLGPRQVGKSTLIRTLSPEVEINLADELEFLRYASQPGALSALMKDTSPKTVFVDEIQRLPSLLNSIQAIIDRDKTAKFYLTGSSARKLRRGHANLLPGRVVNFHLGPFVAKEFGHQMDTQKLLEYGALPEIYLSSLEKENERILKSYSANYIKEEIKAEALVRNLDSFSRFLAEITLSASTFLDYTKLAKKSKISRHAIPRYFEILEDTLIGYRINPFPDPDSKLNLVKHPKFYFFDNGVYNGLLGNFRASLDRIGPLAEQLVFSQLLHSAWSAEREIQIHSFRDRMGQEVDFVVKTENSLWAIEVKHSDDLHPDDLRGLQFFDENVPGKNKALFVFHMGRKEEKRGRIWIVPWQKGLKEMGL